MRNYLPAQYNASDQNRCIIQDLHGRIFAANNDGLLVHDGSGWDKYEMPFLCLSLGKNEKEELFIGGDGNFGKLGRNKKGAYVFDTLTYLIPKEHREVGRIWTIITIKDHVYFCSNEKIYDFDGKTIKVILPGEEGFHTFYKIENTLIVREKGVGLKFLYVNNQLNLFKGGEIFADNSNPVRGIIKGKGDSYYLITPGGVYDFKFNKTLPDLSVITKITTPIDSWLTDKTVYCAANIGNDNFAFGSVNGGLVITNSAFVPVKYINSTNELQDDGVNYIFNDVQGHIWLALAKGISFIEFNSPITRFTKSDGIKGTIEACVFYNRVPYLATDKGTLKYNPALLKFEETNLTEASWCLAQVNGKLLAGTKTGLYILDNNQFKLIYETPSAIHCLFIHPTRQGLIYLGTETGYAKGFLKDKTFTPLKEELESNDDVRTIAIDEEGAVCFATTETGVYIELPGTDSLINLTKKEGLPELKENYLFNYGKQVLVASDEGVYVIRKDNGSYVAREDLDFGMINHNKIIIKGITIKNDIWLTTKPKEEPRSARTNEAFMCFENKNGKFVLKTLQLSRIKESNVKSFCYNDSLVYIGTNNGLFCYDLVLKKHDPFLNTFVNYFSLNGKDTIYNINPRTELETVELNYKNNSVEFKLGASDFLDKAELLFSYYLEGRDKGFSTYANNLTVRYDHLLEGTYTFHVKAKNILGVEGQELKVTFIVLPPWYRTVWAYIFYGIAVILLVYFIIKLNSKRLIAQNIKLENIITDRTKEINKQKLEIEHKNQEITDSINYAKGIQDSILPSISEVKKTWKDLFIFFQPKDIVSGDFYWFRQIGTDKFLIACADCTGHGVPGGFMSMICSDKLHDATRTTTEPEKILALANNSIKETLRQQSEGKSKDGMEICLLWINTKTREVKYAGANRPLWILNGNTKELTEIKPTKASIASFTEFDFKYTQHEFTLNPGDTLYATSDGYPDQFGGPDGKKYMSKNLKNFIIANSHLSMEEQGGLLKQDINKWMERYEQVDDLLVIGVRL